MTTRSSTAPAGNFLPVSILVSLIVLVAMLFVVIQTTNLPIFPTSNSAPYGVARAPLFRGLIHIPLFRFMPLFRSAEQDAADEESHMAASELIDRWEPFIKEASVRYSVPEKWIRTIIHIESGGRTMLWGRPITSGAGAMGVMQLMHDTYNDMSVRNGLGSDPYDVHDNILAGTAYLRELYSRYGYPRLFAAYNAGPAVLEAHMQHGTTLPVETQNYIRLALAGTTTAALATKLMTQVLAKPPAAKGTKIVANKPAAKPVQVVAVHSAAKPVRVAAQVAPGTTDAPVTRPARHRVNAA
jgi:hypothetical protein